MKLATWIDLKGITRAEFAREVGVSGGMITLWCAGEHWPSRENAKRIFEVTKGEVTPSDFFEAAE